MNGPLPTELAQQLEAYLLGDMTKDKAQEFATLAASNPALAEEIALQREILSGIQAARRADLKANLAKVSVSPGPAGSISWRGISMGVAAGVLLVGGITYYALQNSAEEPTTSNVATSQPVRKPAPAPAQPTSPAANEEPTKSQPPVLPTLADLDRQSSPADQDLRIAPAQAEDRTNAGNTGSGARRPSSTAPGTSKARPIATPDVDAENQTGIIRPDLGQLPTGQIVAESEVRSRPEVIIKSSDQLAYQYFDNKLYLYGSFGDAIYELIELNSAQRGRMLYVYHKEAFYTLINGTHDKMEMEALTDPALLAELNLLRKKRVD